HRICIALAKAFFVESPGLNTTMNPLNAGMGVGHYGHDVGDRAVQQCDSLERLEVRVVVLLGVNLDVVALGMQLPVVRLKRDLSISDRDSHKGKKQSDRGKQCFSKRL